LKLLFAIVFIILITPVTRAQDSIAYGDTSLLSGPGTIACSDTFLLTGGDTLFQLSGKVSEDTTIETAAKNKKKSPIESEVLYHSRDSFKISIAEQKVYLYGEAKVNYQNIELTADYIVFDMTNNVVMATSLSDTMGKPTGKPVFTQGTETFQSDTLRYNFETQKGVIKYVFTQQGEGYLHSKQTKRLADGYINLKDGKYTTCDAEHPHFYIGLTKAIAIPEKKIISGPAYLVIEDIPLPLVLPFGFFPNTKERSSGLIIPTYGYEQRRGLYLRNGGWYYAVNDYLDLSLMGDVYSHGDMGHKRLFKIC
jgi:lipopolysaccharide assembly outer membrane protein LptD (OstA)